MNRRFATVVVTAVALLAGVSAPLWAHHAFTAEFDVNKPLKLEGTLKKWEMINPHSWFHVDIKGVTWKIEGGSPNELIRKGVTKETVPIGTLLKIDAYQAKDGSNTAVGRDFTLPNGNRLFLGGSAQTITPTTVSPTTVK
jgi:hypothetical protein